jgi:hypothetical protein
LTLDADQSRTHRFVREVSGSLDDCPRHLTRGFVGPLPHAERRIWRRHRSRSIVRLVSICATPGQVRPSGSAGGDCSQTPTLAAARLASRCS